MSPLSKTVHRKHDLVCSLLLFPRSSFTVPSGWRLSVCVCVLTVSWRWPVLNVKSRQGLTREVSAFFWYYTLVFSPAWSFFLLNRCSHSSITKPQKHCLDQVYQVCHVQQWQGTTQICGTTFFACIHLNKKRLLLVLIIFQHRLDSGSLHLSIN